MTRASTNERRLHLAALAAFCGMTVILLHPLWAYNGVRVAGYDWFNYNWNFWWIRHALATPGLNVYLNDFAMFPAMSNYGYHALAAFWYPLWALIEPWAGTLTAVNVIITLACVLNGYLTFAWLRAEGVRAGMALLGGLMLQTLPISRYFYYNTHLNLTDWFWLPGLLLMWRQIVRAASGWRPWAALGWSAVFGVALWGLLLTDLQFPIFAAAVVAPYGALTLIVGGLPGAEAAARLRRNTRLWLVGCGVVAVAVGLSLMWFAGPFPYIARFQGELVPGPAADRPGIPFPAGFLSMAQEWWQWDRPSLGAFFPLLLLATTIWALVYRRAPSGIGAGWMRWFWLSLALVPLIFAMGPYLHLGETQVGLPYLWIYDLTAGMFRMPWRLAPIGVIAGAAFIGLTWTAILKRRRISLPARVWGGAAALLLLAISVRLFETRPLDPVLPDYDFYRQMGAEQGAAYDDYVVVDAPTGMGTGEVLIGNARAIQYQYYGMLHHKRMVNGFISRAPIDQFYYIETGDPLLSWLGQRVFLDPAAVEPLLRERIYGWPIGYIVLHTDDIGRNSSTPQEIIGYFNQLDDLLCPMWIEGAAVVYRTRWHPDGCPPRTPPESAPGIYTIDLGAAGDERYIGWGWHWQEDVGATRWRWAGEYPEARLYVDLPPGAYRLTLAAQAFWEPRQLELRVNGEPVGDAVAVEPDALQEFTFDVPAEAIGDGQHIEITLAYDGVIVPAEVGQSGDPRKLSVAVDWVRIEASDE
ncbi:MAG: hypothetical protein IT320_08415 [Anaerolineae bacterium]|nr:hypothetical protein [Anaerolineae bacterium]